MQNSVETFSEVRTQRTQLQNCRAIAFNGRSTDARGDIGGSLAEQLGKADQFARYCSPLLQAPDPEAWKQLLAPGPIVLFLDELPPYLPYAVAVPVGNANLGVVTTAALANLFVGPYARMTTSPKSVVREGGPWVYHCINGCVRWAFFCGVDRSGKEEFSHCGPGCGIA